MDDTVKHDFEFWDYLERLIHSNEIVIDRPRGSNHPTFKAMIYPLDYGFLANTKTVDGGGIDVWLGSCPERQLDAAVMTVDLKKQDAEIKLLIGCSSTEKKIILDFLNANSMRALIINRGGGQAWLRSRSSVRKFLPRPIPDGIIKEILETAIWAPSAHNRQPWRFAVVQDQDARTRLAETMSQDFRRDLAADGCTPEAVETQVGRSYQRITNAPVAIVLCLDLSQGDPYPDSVRQQAEFLMGTQSVALAGGYLLLAVHAAGLAGVWMCAPLFAPASVRKSLELPEEWQPQALILIGYPAHEPKARTRKPLDEVVLFR